MKTLFQSLRAALRSLVVVLAALGLLALSPAARATTYTNIAKGNWSASASWTGGVSGTPSAGGSSEVTNYFIPTAIDYSTNNLAGGFWLNQLYLTNNQIVSLNSDGSGNYLLFTNSAIGSLPLLTNAGTASFTNNIAIVLATNLTIATASGSIVINSNLTENTQSQLITAGNGTLTLNGSNVYSGGTVINGGTLTVNGSIFSPNATLNIGAQAGAGGTNVLNAGGSLTVQTLLATNLAIGAPTNSNSIFTFNGGTLTTSNKNGLAANLLVSSNGTLNIGGNWIMNAGTNIVMNVHTNTYTGTNYNGFTTPQTAGTVNFFNGLNNGLVLVNTGAVFLTLPANAIGATNTMTFNLSPAGTGNQFVVNGGQVIATNRFSSGANLSGNALFTFGSGTSNTFIITNGGVVTTLTAAAANGLSAVGGSRNGLYVGGTNAAGNKSAWISGGGNPSVAERFNFNSAGTNWLAVDSGGVVSNVNFFAYNTTWLFVTNGGALYPVNGLIIGRNGNGSQLLVAGVDGAGNKSQVVGINNSQLSIGGGTGTPGAPSPGSNNWVRVDSGGLVTNAAFVGVGQDSNSWNNSLFITNGGQLYCGSAVVTSSSGPGNLQGAYIGFVGNCFSNSVTVGGGTNASLLNLGGGTLAIGNVGAGVSNNLVTVLPGGIVTNLSYLSFGGANAAFNHQNGGTLALNGANVLVSGSGTYNLNGVVSNSSGGTLTFANGAMFAGNATNGGNSVVMNLGSSLAPGGLGTVGSLALSNNLTLNNARLYYSLAAASGSVLNVGNTLTASGVNPVYLSVAGTLPAATYPLITFTNVTAGLTNFLLASGNANASLALTANTLVLQVTGSGLVGSGDVWRGYTNGTWDASTGNWTNGVTVTNFLSGDAVVFDDTLSGNPTVTNATPGAVVTPAAVTFNNSATAYTINANIGGSGSVIKNGTGLVTLTGTNSYSGSTFINAGVLTVTNGGAINAPNSTLVVANTGTNILASGGSITVQSLVVASNVTTVLQNLPAFLFNGGTLTTSNGSGTGYAANILLSSNSQWNINGTWNLNGGTNLVLNANTNLIIPAYIGYAYIGNGVSNALVMVNSNAVLWHAPIPGNLTTNVTSLVVGSGNAANNQLVVNGGAVIITNLNGTATPVLVGNSAICTSNLLTITNGGQVYTAGNRGGGPVAGQIGANGSYNGLYVAGTNGAGRHSLWDFAKDRLLIGASAYTGSTNSWVRVDQDGIVTNASLFIYCINSGLFVTNGGKFYAGVNLTVGRNGTNANLIVWGADPYGNPSFLSGSGSTLIVGGGSAGGMGSNNLALVGPGGVITNVGGVLSGGSGVTDTNNFSNGVVVTNGGQLYSAANSYIGYSTNCNNNFITVGGGTNASLWRLNNNALTIGNASILGVGANNSSNNYAILYTNGLVTNISSVILGGVNSALYFNGGTLAAGSSGNLIATNIANGTTTTNALNATNFVQAGGAIISDSGFVVSSQLAFLPDPNSTGGGLTKLGTGTLVLAAGNSYTGPTVVNAGNLLITNAITLPAGGLLTLNGGALSNNLSCTLNNPVNLNAASTVGVASGQILTLTGAITNNGSLTLAGTGIAAFGGSALTIGGNVIMNAGAQLAPAGIGGIGTLTLTNNLLLNGGTLFFDLNTNVLGTNDLVAVGNTLYLTNVNYVNLSVNASRIPPGNYPLMTFANGYAGNGSFVLAGIFANSAAASLVLNGNSLVLSVGANGLGSETWKGYQSGVWDTSALNWTNFNPIIAYADGDSVLFDDTLVGNSVVSGGPLAPGSVTFNNSLTNYLINASIGGVGGLTKNGTATVTLAGANIYTSNTVINAGTLAVTNGGSIFSPNGTLNIGALAGSGGTLTLTNSGALTVQSLLATNITFAATNSVFNFNGGTLTTSNYNGVAASVLVASNASFTINGNWNLNGGTNIFANVATNGGATANVYLGNGANNVQAVVNPGAVWWSYNSNTLLNAYATNVLTLNIGNGNATNNQFVVNGGTLIATNYYGQNPNIVLGNSGNCVSNQMIVTNGGQVYLAGLRSSGPTVLNVGNAGTNNGVYVGGTNSAGVKSKIDTAIDRIAISSFNNWVRVDQGGLITNATLLLGGNGNNAVYITNGGVIAANYVTLGRGATNSTLNIAGADSAGNPATLSYLNNNALAVGGAYPNNPVPGNPGSYNVTMVGLGGLLTNCSAVYVGGGVTLDTNSSGNALIITNGGQLICGSAGGNSAIGFTTNCNNNYISLGGGGSPSLLNLGSGGHSMTIGNIAYSTNNYLTLFSGGMLTNASSIILGGVNSTLYFNGGTLAAAAAGNLITTNISTLNATNFIQAGGALINDSGFNVTNQLALLQDPNSLGGGLTKLGVGTLALLGTNTFTGPITNSSGTLVLGGTGSLGGGSYAAALVNNGLFNYASAAAQTLGGTISGTGTLAVNAGTLLVNGNASAATNIWTVSSGATLGGSGTIGGNVTLSAGAQLAPAGVGAVGILNLTNSLSLNGGTLFYDLNTNSVGTNDLVAVGNALYLTNVNFVNLSVNASRILPGNYTLMTFANGYAGTGSFVLVGMFANTPNATLVLNSTSLVLSVGATGLTGDTWKGYQSGVWDTSALNWTNGNPIFAYTDGDSVLFDDTLVGNSVVSGGPLAPGSVLFNNSLTNYIINAAIGGTGVLTKSGTATVTLAGANTYTSNTVINAGTLWVTNGGSIFSPNGTLNIGAQTGAAGTLTLTTNGNVTVQTVLATNVPLYGSPNSIFTLNGGTLTTSNGNGVAANILVQSNANWFIAGNWNMLGGTNYTASAQISAGAGAAFWGGMVVFNNNATNGMILVSNAVWSTFNPLTPGNPTNVLPVNIGYGYTSSNNVLNITNGGLVYVGQYTTPNGGPIGFYVGNNYANNNGLIVAGANGAGRKSLLDLGNSRLSVGTSISSVLGSETTNNWCVVNGGVITNVGIGGLYMYGANNSLVVTNGGQIYLNSGQSFSLGREGVTNNYCLVGGLDAGGNPSTLNFLSSFGNGPGAVYIGGVNGAGDSLLSATNNWLWVGQGGLVTNANQMIVGNNTNANGNYLIITNGGQVFSLNTSYVGCGFGVSNCLNNYAVIGGTFGTTNSLWNLGSASLIIGGTLNASNNYVTLAAGGVLTNVSQVQLGGINSRFIFNGGMLAAAGSGSLFLTNSGPLALNPTNFIQAGGALINDSGYSVTISLPLTGDPGSPGGGLTKLGAGSLTLTASNTYTGPTTISAGSLVVASNFAINTNTVVLNGGALFAGATCTLTNAINLNAASGVGVGPGGILTLTGFISNTNNLTVGGSGVTVFGGNAATISGSVTLSAGAQLAPGGLGTVGALNLTNNLTLNGGGTLLFDVTSSGNDLIAVGNNLAASGVTTIFVSVPSPLAQGTSYPLITFTNTSATLANFVLAGISTNKVTLALTANTLVLQVASGSGNIGLAGDTWKGYQSGTWDASVLNWTNANPIVAYVDNNDSVLFDDSLVGNPIITNALPTGVVSPAAVTFNNNLTNYVINASIGGTNTLNKYGFGMVTLGGTNSFTGGINLYAGTLSVTNDRSLGASNVTENITLNGSGTLQINGANFPLNTNRILKVTGAGGTLYGNGVTFILTNNILQGSGPLFLTGNSYATTTPLVTGSQSNYSGTVIVVSGRPGVGANNITNPYGTGTIIITNGNGGNVGSEMFLQSGTNCVFGNTFILSGTGSEGFGAIRTPAPQIFTNTIILTNYPYPLAQLGSPEVSNSTNYYYGQVTGPANFGVGRAVSVANTWNIFTGANTYTGSTSIGMSGFPTMFMIGGSGSLSGGNYAGYITNYGAFVYGAAGAQTLSGTMSGTGSNIITAGILTLTGANYYTGSTFVNGGELLVNGNNAAATGAVQVNMGILGGTGTMGGNVNVSAILAAGGTNNIGTLTLTNSLTLNNGVLLADLSSVAGTSDLVVVGGTLTLNGANLVSLAFPSGSAPAGTYTLMTYASRTGSGTLTLNGSYPNTGLAVGPTSVTLTVTNGSISAGSIPTPFNWYGNLSGSWDINATQNWLTNGTSAVYLDGNAVTFDDTAVSYIVTNATGATFFSPASVKVFNNNNSYLISANLGGAATVTKLGGNVLTLNGNNTFSGGLVMNDGVLNLNSSNNFSGGLVMNYGTVNLVGTNAFSGGLTLNGGTLNFNNAYGSGVGTLTINGGIVDNTSGIAVSNANNNAQTWNTNFTFGGTANLNLGAGTVTLNTNVTVTGATGNALTLAGNISLGNNYLTHVGNGGLVLGGIISGTGGVTNSAGYLYLTNVQNSYSGITSLSGGTNYFISLAPVNGGPSSLGNPSSQSNGVLNVSGSLVFLGAGTYTSDRVINSIGGFTFYNNGGGTLILSGGITNNGVTFRGGVGNIVETGPLILGVGTLGRTDPGTVTLTNSLNSFTNYVNIQVGTFVVDTLANAGAASSIGAGPFINLGQNSTIAQGILQFVGTNGTVCNRNIYVENGPVPTDGGCLSNTVAGNTVTFSGNISVGNALISTVTNNWTMLGLGGAGNGVISGTLGGGTAVSNHLGIVKTGAGIWTLSGVNTNNGPIIVTAGALFINGNSGAVTNNPILTNHLAGYSGFIAGTNSVTVAGGATFGGSGIIGGNVYLSNGATLIPGGGAGTNVGGSLTLMTINLTSGATYANTNFANSTLTLNGDTLVFNLFNNGTCNQVLNGGNLTNNGANLISLSFPGGSVPAGNYILMTNANTFGSGTIALAGSYTNLTLNKNVSNIWVTVGAGGSSGGLGNNLTAWRGYVNGSWDINTTVNWQTNGLVGTYSDGNAVLFDDNLASNSVIAGATVTPGSVMFNNSLTNYTINANLAGTGPLTKSGLAMVSLVGSNSFSGGVVLNAGTLNLSTNYALGTGAFTINGGTLDNTSGASNSIPTGNAMNWNGSFAFAGSASLNLGAGPVTMNTNVTLFITNNALTISGNLNNGGYSLAHSVGGTLMINGILSGTGGFTNNAGFSYQTGLSTYTGPTVFNGGTNYFNSITTNGGVASALGAPTNAAGGVITISGGANPWYTGTGISTSDRIINWQNGTLYNGGPGTLVLTGGITNNNTSIIFRGGGGGGNIVESGVIGIGSGNLTRTDGGILYLTNALSPFTGNIFISNGTNSFDTIANSGSASSLGAGSAIYLAQMGYNAAGALQFLGTNGSACNRTIYLNGGTGANSGGLIEIAPPGTTLTFSGNFIVQATNLVAASTTALTLCGAGNGVISGSLGGTNALNLLTIAKSGTGTWTLSGINTNTGTVTVSAGTLLLNGNSLAATNTVTVSAGARFGGTGTNGGSVVMNAGAELIPGGAGNAGRLLLTNNLTLNGNYLLFNLPNSLVAVGNNLSASGSNIVVLSNVGNIPAANYTLMTFTNLTAGAIGNFALAGNPANATLALNANSLVLQVTGGGLTSPGGDIWKGFVSGTWDATTANWTNGVPSNLYTSGDAVTFDDTLAGNLTVGSGVAVVTPASVNFNNYLASYTINANVGGSGSLTLSGAGAVTLTGSNSYAGNTTINAGTLTETNGGSIFSPNGTLNIGATAGLFATNTLAAGGNITVQTLLATNISYTATNSIFNFNGGTLTTSNNNGLAANVLVTSNAGWNLNGVWNANAGTNIIVGMNTNGGSGAVYLGNSVNGAQLNVNSNAVWWHQLAVPGTLLATNEINLNVGNNAATNNQLVINGGTVIITNGYIQGTAVGGITAVSIGISANSVNNQVVVTNGGQLITRGRGDSGFGAIIIGTLGTNNSFIVGGTNAAGVKSLVDCKNDRFYVGNNLTAGAYCWAQVGAGGVVTNVNFYTIANNTALYITNGGQFYANGFIVGRNASNSVAVVGGTDPASGSKSLLGLASYNNSTSFPLTVGGGSGTTQQPSYNNTMRIDGGLVTNVGSVAIGGGSSALADSNVVGNVLIITNGGQLFNAGTSWVGYQNGSASNQLSLGGGSGMSLWRMNNNPLTLGNDLYASNNVMTLFSGGVLTNVSSLILGGSYSVLNFNGGTLAAGGNGNLIATNSGSILNATNLLLTNICYLATNYIQVGGAIIDSVNFTVTNVVPFAQDPGSPGGGLTKLGVGTLVLATNNTYTGPTVVTAGNLLINNAITLPAGGLLTLNGGALSNNLSCTLNNPVNLNAASTVGVAAGQILTLIGAITNNGSLTLAGTGIAAFGGSALIIGGNVIMNAGVGLAPAGIGGIGTLTLTNSLTLNGNSLYFDVTSAANDLVAISNSLTLNGVNPVNLTLTAGRLAAGSYPLMTFANGYTGSGSFVLNGIFTNAVNATLNIVNGKSLVLQVGSGGFDVDTWKGYQSGVWDASTPNWTNGSIAVAYADGDSVIFDDTLVGNSVISGGPLAPASVLFNNSLTNYFINAAIGGAGVLTKSGSATVTLAGANIYASNTVINAGTLAVTNGGSIFSPNGTLNIGALAGSAGTLTLAAAGNITVQTLLATNVVNATANSTFNFNSGGTLSGGTLTTSNYNGLAASILVASNAGWNINGKWIMNAGTNLVIQAATNTGGSGSFTVGSGFTGAQAIVNPNAVLWVANVANSAGSNVLSLNIGSGNATNNQLVVNGGTVIATNYASVAGIGSDVAFTLGSGAGSVGSQMIITNGGQVFTRGGATGNNSLVANNGANNGVYIGGTNAAGQKATWAFLGGECMLLGLGTSSNIWVAVDSGGVLTNVFIHAYNNSTRVYVTNGGLLYPAAELIIGRASLNNSLLVGGQDGAGNKATVSFFGGSYLTVGGGTQVASSPSPGTNSVAQIDAFGVLTNCDHIIVGQDTNSVGNMLIITNGGQVFDVGSGGNSCAIGYVAGCNSNSASIGGGTGLSLWDLNKHTLILGNNTVGGVAAATNNSLTLFSGGLLTNVLAVSLNGAGSTLNFNGGVLAAGAGGNLITNGVGAVNATVFVQAGGAVINDNGYVVTNPLALVQDPNSIGGGLTKLGGGTNTLLGVNTYTGPTVVRAGTLALSGGASIANSSSIVLAGGTLFNVAGLSSTFALANNQVLSNSTSTATINGPLNTASGKVSLTYVANTPSLAVTNGTLTLSVGTTFTVNSAGLLPGTYKLISKLSGGAVAVSGSLPAVTVVGGPNQGIPTLSLSGGELYLTVGGVSTWSYSGTSFTYNGAAQSPSLASFSGSTATMTTNYVGVSPTSYGPSVSAPTNAGSYYVTNTVPPDANYFGATYSQGFTIGKVTPTVLVTPYHVAYNGNPHTAGVSITGVNGETGATVGSVTLSTTHTVVGTYAGDSWSFAATTNYNDIATTIITDTIDQTNLTVTAQFNTKVYDTTTSATNTPLTGPGSIQSGDGAILTETYATATAGTGKTLNPAVVSITNAAGVDMTANYNVTLVPVSTGVITAAPAPFNLFSATPTNGYHDGVFFIATNLPVDAGSNVVFQANGVAFSTNDLANGGTTSLAITNLPRGGTNIIIATYHGDNNYSAYVTNLIQTVTNHPPVATNLVVYRTAGEPLRVFWTNIATYWSDVDGDTVTNLGINLVTTNGITLLTNSSEIIYTNSPDVNDQFSYTIADGYGGTNTGIVDIIIDFSDPFVGQENTTIISTNGGVQMTFYGVLGKTYVVQRNVTDITDTNYWLNFITNSVITNQVMTVTDTNNPYAYYRLKYQRAP